MNTQRTVMLILVAGVLTIMFAVAVAQENQSEASGTKSRIEVAEPQFDFGCVAQESDISHVFWMKNAGSDPLRIKDVKPGCGCTKAPFEPKTLAAGESTHVELIFSTGHYSSKVRKNARIISDATGTVPRLSFQADVRPAIDAVDVFTVQPYQIDLDKNEPAGDDGNREYQLTLKNLSDEDLMFTLVSAPDGLVTIDLREGILVGAGEQVKFTARFDQGIAADVFTKSFTVQASDANQTRFTVPISKTLRWGPAPTSQR